MSEKEISLDGLIVPADWDDNDDVTLVCLLTDDEGEYLVEGDPVGRELIRCIHKRVRVVGRLGKDDSGESRVTVRGFRVLDF